MKLLNTYKSYDNQKPWLIEIPITNKSLITLHKVKMVFTVYHFRNTNSLEWCGGKLTRKDNEIISNLQK